MAHKFTQAEFHELSHKIQEYCGKDSIVYGSLMVFAYNRLFIGPTQFETWRIRDRDTGEILWDAKSGGQKKPNYEMLLKAGEIEWYYANRGRGRIKRPCLRPQPSTGDPNIDALMDSRPPTETHILNRKLRGTYEKAERKIRRATTEASGKLPRILWGDSHRVQGKPGRKPVDRVTRACELSKQGKRWVTICEECIPHYHALPMDKRIAARHRLKSAVAMRNRRNGNN